MTDIAISSPCLSARSLRDRITVCSGATAPDPSPLDGGDKYLDGALVAKGPWRAVDDALWKTLHADAPRTIGTTVFLDRPEDRLIDWLRDFESDGPKHPVTSMRAATAVRRDVERMLDSCASVHRLGPVLGIGPAPRNPGGLETLTRSYPEALRTGLHIDHWDHLPLTRCGEAANRLCVNLGEGARFLLFAAVSSVQMHRRVQAHDPYPGPIARSELVPAYLAVEPSTPILRLEIRPGEAYYAPTENLLHDASNLGTSCVDRTVQIRGFLMPAGSMKTTRNKRPARKPLRRIPIRTIASPITSPGVQP